MNDVDAVEQVFELSTGVDGPVDHSAGQRLALGAQRAAVLAFDEPAELREGVRLSRRLHVATGLLCGEDDDQRERALRDEDTPWITDQLDRLAGALERLVEE